jgi:hypothetical protein
MNVMMQHVIRSARPIGQIRVLIPHHGIFSSRSMNVSVRKANVANLPVQDWRSVVGLTEKAETIQTTMKDTQHRVMKCVLMK